MKALSIISTLLSAACCVYSVKALIWSFSDKLHGSLFQDYEVGPTLSIISFILLTLSLYFLAFSITVLINSFKRKEK